MIKSCKTNFKSRLLPSPRLSEDVLLPILRLYALATLDTGKSSACFGGNQIQIGMIKK